jgi:hypothetical protein
MRKLVDKYLKPKLRDGEDPKEKTETVIEKAANGHIKDEEQVEEARTVIKEVKQKMKFAMIMFLLCPLALVGCMSAEHQDAINKEVARIAELTEEFNELKAIYEEMKEKYEAGNLSLADISVLGEVKDSMDTIITSISAAKTNIEAVKEQSKASWFELIGSMLLGALGLRGSQTNVARNVLKNLAGGPSTPSP